MPKCFRYKDEYYDEDNESMDTREFRCYLESKQCEAQSYKTQQDCRNTVIMGLPYCHAHAKIIYEVVIKDSQYHGRDKKGLFAHNPKADRGIVFRRGDVLFKFEGQMRTRVQMRRRYGDMNQVVPPYGIQLSPDRYIDAACKRSVASMMNHAPLRDANVVLRRSRSTFYNRRTGIPAFRARFTHVDVIATKTIYHGDEILTNYGPGYRVENTHKTYNCPYSHTWDRNHRGL